MPLETVHSTLAGAAIARLVEDGWAVGAVAGCHLLKRGFNDVYQLRMGGGGRLIARLSDLRPRGPINIAYETAFLAHLKASGVAVSAALTAKDGALWRAVEAPEGSRPLAVFEHLPGHVPVRTMILTGRLGDAEADMRLLGAGLAAIHGAGASYAGRPSLFRLDADHLLRAPLARLLAAPILDDELREGFAAVGAALDVRLEAVLPRLSVVACHGDNHGGNTFMSNGPGGERIAAWFDFDEAAPGFLAYDLAVLVWSMLKRLNSAGLNATAQAMWLAFLEGYLAERPTPTEDLDAIGIFVSVRNIWFLGEYAARLPEWGVETLERDWLVAQLKLMREWETMETPRGLIPDRPSVAR